MLTFSQMASCLICRLLCMCHKEINKYNMVLIAFGTGLREYKVWQSRQELKYVLLSGTVLFAALSSAQHKDFRSNVPLY